VVDQTTRHRVKLAWADHDHLSGGGFAPSRVAEAILALAAEVIGRDQLPGRFDASTIRRMIPEFDSLVRDRLPVG
jgi:hypothetical protein